MDKPYLSLAPSEAVVAAAAATIYTGHVAAGRVADGTEKKWIRKSIQEAFWIASMTDAAIRSDDEVG